MLALSGGVVQARRILARIDPASVVGFGGYPCVAPVLATRLMRRRPAVLLHEQNAVLGRANRFLLRVRRRAGLEFCRDDAGAGEPRPRSSPATPCARRCMALADLPYAPPTGAIRLLVLGGSLGARVFSDVVPTALAALPAGLRARLTVVQQCRPEDLDRVRAAYADRSASPPTWRRSSPTWPSV